MGLVQKFIICWILTGELVGMVLFVYHQSVFMVWDKIRFSDFDAEVERPCQVYDLNCIRQYFANHSMCKISRGPLPRNLFISQENIYVSRVNLTLALDNVRVGGFRNTRIEEF